jgi:hypothetical protein
LITIYFLPGLALPDGLGLCNACSIVMEELEMDAQLKAKWWTAALRSGEFKQGIATLRRMSADGEEHYCCLGVLCVVAGIAISEDGGRCAEDAQMGYSPIRRVLNAPSDSEKYATSDKLANMNDGGSSFAEIADYIDANL